MITPVRSCVRLDDRLFPLARPAKAADVRRMARYAQPGKACCEDNSEYHIIPVFVDAFLMARTGITIIIRSLRSYIFFRWLAAPLLRWTHQFHTGTIVECIGHTGRASIKALPGLLSISVVSTNFCSQSYSVVVLASTIVHALLKAIASCSSYQTDG